MNSPSVSSVGCDLPPTNPFCTRLVRPGAIPYRFDSVDLPGTARQRTCELVDRIKRAGVAAIVGPHGSGKSTLLQSLRPELQQRYRRVIWIGLHAARRSGWRRRFQHAKSCGQQVQAQLLGLAADDLLVLDGFEQLTRWTQWRIRRSSQNTGFHLFVTAHRRPPMMPVILETGLSPSMIKHLTLQRVVSSSRQVREGIEAELAGRSLETISNLRDFWFELYDLVADMNINPAAGTSNVASRHVPVQHRPVQHPEEQTWR